jgi:hypothetical protein
MTPNHERLREALRRSKSKTARLLRQCIPPQRLSDHLAGQVPRPRWQRTYYRLARLPYEGWHTAKDIKDSDADVQRGEGVRR